MQDFNHPDPQNERRVNQSVNPEPAPQSYQQPIPPVTPAPPPVTPASQPQYQQPQQTNYQQNYQQPQQPQQYQQQYQAPQQQTNYQQQYQQNHPEKFKTFPPVKTGEWMLTMFLMTIPLVGSIMLFVWAFSSDTNPSKSSWAKATLIWGVITSVLIVIVYAIIFLIAGISYSSLNLG